MTRNRFSGLKPELRIYLVILAMSALAMAFSNDVMANYFKDAYQVTAYQRGLLEFPRETPGMLCMFVVALLSFFGDVRTAIIAQILTAAGIAVLGLMTPSFGVMLVFLFINSLGMHLFMPLQDGIAMSLIEEGQYGRRMGQFKGITTTFQLIGAVMVFALFRLGMVDFTVPVKWIFLASAILLVGVAILLSVLRRRLGDARTAANRVRFVFRKEYRFYYTLVVMLGVQKQIMIVYGPWVLIDLLSQKVDTIALLSIAGSLIGMFFIPALGRWTDRFGLKAMLYGDALSFIGVYLLYGLLSGGYASGAIAVTGWTVFLAFGLFILDRMSSQMGFIRTVYLKSISVDPADITPTLSMGISLDHFVSIICAYLGGIVWTQWGPQYIFYLAAALSCVNLYVAIRVKIPKVGEKAVVGGRGAEEAIADSPADCCD